MKTTVNYWKILLGKLNLDLEFSRITGRYEISRLNSYDESTYSLLSISKDGKEVELHDGHIDSYELNSINKFIAWRMGIENKTF